MPDDWRRDWDAWRWMKFPDKELESSQLTTSAQSAFRGQALIGSLRQERSLLISTSVMPMYDSVGVVNTLF
jgi:hypothetical protein